MTAKQKLHDWLFENLLDKDRWELNGWRTALILKGTKDRVVVVKDFSCIVLCMGEIGEKFVFYNEEIVSAFEKVLEPLREEEEEKLYRRGLHYVTRCMRREGEEGA